ncbi:hypothetical protein [uncultured Brevundimonas sp.]|uniref:hypothetical protein n=1 Tax=uncultured Brevundimonas sp. TaxID=213418 RepID=UPI0025E5772D|nr:hypothetical protein [uncultured Brevundimonas sp.]
MNAIAPASSFEPQVIARDELLSALRDIVGRKHVLTGPKATRRYRRGYRFGDGQVEAVIRPGSLVEQWRAFKTCVEAGQPERCAG